MARTHTAQETRDEYVTLMGTELGPVFYALYNETAWLHVRWRQLTVLFGTSPERINLVNAAAGLFFRLVQDSLWEDTLLHLSRVTDNTETGGKRNLTIRRLPDLVQDPVLQADLGRLVADAVAKTAFARDWRNRRIAHHDLALAVTEGAEPLAPASRSHVRTALDAVGLVLNRLEQHYKDGTIFFEALGNPGDAEALLYVIRDGVEAEEARRKRVLEGRLLPEDVGPPRAV